MPRSTPPLLAVLLLLAGAAPGHAEGQSASPPPQGELQQAPPAGQGEAGTRSEPAPLPRIPGVTVPLPPESDNPHGGGGCRYRQRPLELIV